MRFIVNRNPGEGTATIGMVGDSEGDPFVDLMLTVSDANAEQFRDALVAMYPVDDPAGQDDWRGDDEWTDIASLRDLVHCLGDSFDDVIHLLKWAKSGCCGNGVPNPFTASSAPSDGDVHIRTIAR